MTPKLVTLLATLTKSDGMGDATVLYVARKQLSACWRGKINN